MYKIRILIYKDKFVITDKDKEDYFRWYYLSEPHVITKENIEMKVEKLRLKIAWIKKIAEKYHKGFLDCRQWEMNEVNNKITIL